MRQAAIILAGLLGLALTGCSTEVVDFTVKGSSAGDMSPGNCTVKEISFYERCTFCGQKGWDGYATTCEDLVCKYLPVDGGTALTCKFCWWNKHPKDPCKICTDSTTKKIASTCHKEEHTK